MDTQKRKGKTVYALYFGDGYNEKAKLNNHENPNPLDWLWGGGVYI